MNYESVVVLDVVVLAELLFGLRKSDTVIVI
jgi:hypothetical protein